jgi:hypothetical protein
MSTKDENTPKDLPLRTIRSKLNAPPAGKVTQRHIAAIAKAAEKLNARIALKNGMVIGPSGLEDLWFPSEAETGKPSPLRSDSIN